jgi:hypothetical protein
LIRQGRAARRDGSCNPSKSKAESIVVPLGTCLIPKEVERINEQVHEQRLRPPAK